MLNFIIAYWDSIICIVLIILFLVYLYRKGQKKLLNEILFYLVTLAEEQFGSGTGELKFAAVSTWLYDRLPAIARVLFTKKQIDNMIENAVEKMKDYLANNPQAKALILQEYEE